jgi:TonB-linked SusC/RagA family outer membrane protein
MFIIKTIYMIVKKVTSNILNFKSIKHIRLRSKGGLCILSQLFAILLLLPVCSFAQDRKTLDDEPSIPKDTVVVSALGLKKTTRSLTYNVLEISGEELNKIPDAGFVNKLNGRIAGIAVNGSASGIGGSTRIVMRGTKSISGNNNAVYVVDGIPMLNIPGNQPEGIYTGSGQTGDGISSLNPDDIESISVLTGPAAAALYGSSGANGIVLVTTKKGQKEKLSIHLVSGTLFSSPLVLPKFQNTYGQSESGSYYSWGDKLTTPSSYSPSDFFQTGARVSNAVSLSTGSKHNQTYISFGSVNSQGIIHNNDYNRYNFTLRNTFTKSKLTLDFGFMYSNIKEQNMISQGLNFNPLVPLYLFPAGDDFSKTQIYQRYDAVRNFQTQFWPYGDQGFSMQNPYWITEHNMFINHKDRYAAQATLTYSLSKGFDITGRAKMDKNDELHEKKHSASTSTLFASENGYYASDEIESEQWYAEVLMNMHKHYMNQTIGLTATLGSSIENNTYNQSAYGGNLDATANLFTFSNVNALTAESSQSEYRKEKQAVFASTQLDYKKRVYLNITARNDWAPVSARSKHKSAFYPSIGLAGIITDIFDCQTDMMPFMKMRMAYAEVGNEAPLFAILTTSKLIDSIPEAQTRMPNPNLKPERTKSWETGLNFAFFKNRVKLDITAYHSKTYNQFFEPSLSAASGYKTVILNAGRIDNKGIEASLRYDSKFGKLKWDSYLIFSLNRNKVVELLPEWTNPTTGETTSLAEIDMGGTGSYKMMLKEGGSMGDIYVSTLKTDEHGAIYVHPSDHTVTLEADNFVYAGSSDPKFNLSWGNNFRWNGISLGFLLSARFGGIVVSNTQAIMDAFGASQASANARDAGGALVNGSIIPAKAYYQTAGGGTTAGAGAMYCYSATNVRLGELTVGYDVPVANWCKFAKRLNVSFVGSNLYMFYNKAPFDPELASSTGTYYQGIDYFMQPSLRSLGFSVKLQF